MIRVAAVGDVHVGIEDAGAIAEAMLPAVGEVDVLLLAGDLTRHGDPAEAKVLADDLARLDLPIFAVLGNHDHHMDQGNGVARALRDVGVAVLEGSAETIDVGGERLAIVGAKGFCGGFAGACGSEFGEPEMKAFIRHTREGAARLAEVLAQVEADRTVVLLHYSPAEATCVGERREIFPFLGSYLLAEAIDRTGADLVVHGHAHHGSERGATPGGVPVRNVARPLIGTAWRRFEFESPARARPREELTGRAV